MTKKFCDICQREENSENPLTVYILPIQSAIIISDGKEPLYTYYESGGIKKISVDLCHTCQTKISSFIQELGLKTL